MDRFSCKVMVAIEFIAPCTLCGRSVFTAIARSTVYCSEECSEAADQARRREAQLAAEYEQARQQALKRWMTQIELTGGIEEAGTLFEAYQTWESDPVGARDFRRALRHAGFEVARVYHRSGIRIRTRWIVAEPCCDD